MHDRGVVRSIRRPDLPELRGPLFLSLPPSSDVTCLLRGEDGANALSLVYTACGPPTEEMRRRMPHGWNRTMDRVAAKLA